jgi:AraC family transcriptional regulator of adaptative response/methylated-DNA-[protein]-cysteine methyltransferase
MTRTVDYDYFASPLGECLVAATERGICHLDFTDNDPSRALERLADRYPDAQLVRAGLGDRVRLAFEAGDGSTLTLDLRGTPFQIEVWEALQGIPAGRTVTYGELASQLGRPGAARAVGGAVARNPIAGLVPCHRVVAAGGGLGGYRWGQPRKARWLAREGRDLP